MKKIAILMYYMNCGGVEIALINLLKRIPPEKFHIDLYLLEKKGEFLERIPEYVNVIEIKTTPLEKQMVEERGVRPILKKSLRMSPKVFIEALWLSAKYVVFRRMKMEYYVYKAVFGQKKSLGTYDQVWDFHGYNTLTTYLAANLFAASSKSFWIHCEEVSKEAALYPKTMQRFDQIFAVSSTCATIYNQYYDAVKAKVFYNFIDKERILQHAKVAVVLEKENQVLTLVTVGRLSPPKGYDTALLVANQLRAHGVNFKWYFVGGGEDEAMLKEQCTALHLDKYIVFVGFTSNPYAYMQICDIYVQPSRFEGYAVTLMEAIVLKKVIVTTDVSGSEEAVFNGYNGLIVHHDVDELVQAIVSIWKTPNRLKKMQANANQKGLSQSKSEEILNELLYSHKK